MAGPAARVTSGFRRDGAGDLREGRTLVSSCGRVACRAPGDSGETLGSRAPRGGAAPTAGRVRFRIGSSRSISNSGETLGSSGENDLRVAHTCAHAPLTREIAPCGPTAGALSRVTGPVANPDVLLECGTELAPARTSACFHPGRQVVVRLGGHSDPSHPALQCTVDASSAQGGHSCHPCRELIRQTSAPLRLRYPAFANPDAIPRTRGPCRGRAKSR
jgi:hypothetical protein